jgi:hypothetical protein
MKQDNLQDKIAKLPLWARDHITKIEREREVAVQALNEYCDTQTPAPFYCDEYESTGEDREPTSKRRYFQGHRITVEWLGVRLGVLLRKDNNGTGIDLHWEDVHSQADVALIPRSYQQVYLVAREHMYHWKPKG